MIAQHVVHKLPLSVRLHTEIHTHRLLPAVGCHASDLRRSQLVFRRDSRLNTSCERRDVSPCLSAATTSSAAYWRQNAGNLLPRLSSSSSRPPLTSCATVIDSSLLIAVLQSCYLNKAATVYILCTAMAPVLTGGRGTVARDTANCHKQRIQPRTPKSSRK